MNSIQVGIEGMTCANCVNRVERTLGRAEDVAEAKVNLATERATVRYLPGTVGPSDLTKVIEGAGDLRGVPTAMGLSSVFVLTNALRLRRFRPPMDAVREAALRSGDVAPVAA